jgi:hypothetical protein
VEEYRAAAGVRSLKEISLLYMNIALGAAIAVSIIELPAILFGQTAALFICSSGWVVIFGFTLHRAWQLTDPGSFGKFDIFQIVCGAALLMGLGAILCGFAVVEPTRTIPAFELVRVIFVLNACAAMEAMVVAIFALNVLYRVLGMMNPLRR